MNIFSKLLLVWYSETMLSSWASETSKVSDDAQKFLPSNVTAGDSIVGWRHREEARDGLLDPHEWPQTSPVNSEEPQSS